MKIVAQSGCFVFDVGGGVAFTVTFMFHLGMPTKVHVKSSDGVSDFEIENYDGRLKPCVTHAKRCIGRTSQKGTTLRKVDEPKPGLKIYRG